MSCHAASVVRFSRSTNAAASASRPSSRPSACANAVVSSSPNGAWKTGSPTSRASDAPNSRYITIVARARARSDVCHELDSNG